MVLVLHSITLISFYFTLWNGLCTFTVARPIAAQPNGMHPAFGAPSSQLCGFDVGAGGRGSARGSAARPRRLGWGGSRVKMPRVRRDARTRGTASQ